MWFKLWFCISLQPVQARLPQPVPGVANAKRGLEGDAAVAFRQHTSVRARARISRHTTSESGDSSGIKKYIYGLLALRARGSRASRLSSNYYSSTQGISDVRSYRQVYVHPTMVATGDKSFIHCSIFVVRILKLLYYTVAVVWHTIVVLRCSVLVAAECSCGV